MKTKAELDAAAAAEKAKNAPAATKAGPGETVREKADRTKDKLYGDFTTPGTIAGHLTTQEAAQRLGIHKSRLDQMARWNDPRVAGHVKAGLTRLFPVAVVKSYFESDRTRGPKSALKAEAAAAPARDDQPALPGLDAKPAGKKRSGGPGRLLPADRKRTSTAHGVTIRSPSGSKGKPGGPKPVKGKPAAKPKPVPKPSANGHARPAKAAGKKPAKKTVAAAA